MSKCNFQISFYHRAMGNVMNSDMRFDISLIGNFLPAFFQQQADFQAITWNFTQNS